jgi:hypothetical protein
MNKEKKELQNELENRTTELLSTAEALEEKTKEVEVLSFAHSAATKWNTNTLNDFTVALSNLMM